MTDLLPEFTQGMREAVCGSARGCPYLRTSAAWMAWQVGWHAGQLGWPMPHRVTASRGQSVRVNGRLFRVALDGTVTAE